MTEKPHRQAQKDGDARWTKKRGKSYFGYNDHIEIDAEHWLIRRYVVTDASVWDAQVLGHEFGPESNMSLGLGLWAWAVSFCARLV